MEKLVEFRRLLHRFPDPSGKENATAEKLLDFIRDCKPDVIIPDLGGNGMAWVYNGKPGNKTLMFRCELDAILADEINDIPYASENPGVAHLCGHDGHMAVMAGLAKLICNEKRRRVRVVFFFKPEEETGQGAKKVLKSCEFGEIIPDYILAVHNLPGFPAGTVILSKSVFSSASSGMIIRLQGKTAHAAEPEKGNNPSLAVSDIIREFSALSLRRQLFKDFVKLTLIHVSIGEVAFGTSPGKAVVMATLRAFREDDMRMLISNAENISRHIAKQYGLEYNISFTEEFPVVKNNPMLVDMAEKVAGELGMKMMELITPMKWSEDFGHFTDAFPAALIGIGSGQDQPELHNPDFDFPDVLLQPTVDLLFGMYSRINYL